MFGQNEVVKEDYDPQGKLWVREVFYTIQGEGPDAGTPAVFVRLAGCNLRCYFCCVGATQVFMPGGKKPIKDVRVGDSVFSYDLVANKLVLDTVTRIYRRSVRQVLKIRFREG